MGSEIIRDQNLTQGRSQGRKPDSIIIQCLLDLLHFFIRVIDQIFSIHSTHLHIRHSQSFQSCDLSCQFRCDFICKTCDFYCHSFVLLNKCLSYQIQYQCLPFFWKWHVFLFNSRKKQFFIQRQFHGAVQPAGQVHGIGQVSPRIPSVPSATNGVPLKI